MFLWYACRYVCRSESESAFSRWSVHKFHISICRSGSVVSLQHVEGACFHLIVCRSGSAVSARRGRMISSYCMQEKRNAETPIHQVLIPSRK